MIRVAGLWDLGWNTPIMEHDEWSFLIRDFKVDEWVMSKVSGIESIDVTEVEDLIKYLDTINDSKLIFIDEGGTTELIDFVHPVDATYVFGKANFSVWASMGSLEPSVKINTPSGLGGFWAHQALAVVLYDRYMKESAV